MLSTSSSRLRVLWASSKTACAEAIFTATSSGFSSAGLIGDPGNTTIAFQPLPSSRKSCAHAIQQSMLYGRKKFDCLNSKTLLQRKKPILFIRMG